MTENQLWLQQAGEGDTAYRYFATYRDTEPAKRRVADVARIHDVSIRTVQGHCTKYEWKNRARALDRHNDAAATGAATIDIASERADLQRRGIELTRSTLDLSKRVLNEIDPTDMDSQQAALMRTILTTFGRLALPDELTDNGTNIPLTTDYVDNRMRKLAAEAAARRDA